ncbi:MAG: haloalkane dehalogenase [Halieaceae bacterium]|jgi:haloalkane dehalogenase
MNIRKSYVDGRWGQVHVREIGEGPPLLLLHQSPLSGRMFDAVMPLLAAAGYHVAAIDTAGYGNSDAPDNSPSIIDHGEAIANVLEALQWPQCHILGHHTGAAIGAAFAARHPDRVQRLVLNGVPLFGEAELELFKDYEFKAILPEADGSHLLDAWNMRLSASPGWSNLNAMHRYTVEMLAINETYHLGFRAAFDHDMKADLLAIQTPTLIFTNTEEDLYGASCRAAELRPDFDFAELIGGTHDIIDEQPQAWAAAVVRYLKADEAT